MGKCFRRDVGGGGGGGGGGKKSRNWAEETAKRIHVVVRVRPLNYREIKENAKVIKAHFPYDRMSR